MTREAKVGFKQEKIKEEEKRDIERVVRAIRRQVI
jgi:hypothetical protein